MTLLILMLPLFVFSETTVQKISSQRDWQTIHVTDHRAFGSDACIAETSDKGGKARLEIYAEKSEQQGHLDYVVLITTQSKNLLLGGEMKFSNKTFPLSRFDDGSARDHQIYISRWSDREDIILQLKRGLRVNVELRDSTVKQSYQFSLRGSTNGINSLRKSCQQ